MKNELRLQPIRAADVDHVMTWVNDSEVIKNFQHFGRRFTRKEELAFIRKLLKDGTNATFSIFRRKDGVYVGQCAINQISWENRLGRVALIIARERWGHGYAQQAMELLLKHAFRKLKLNKVWGMVYASNKKGLHVDLKIGFKIEGRLSEEYFWRGRYHDIVRIGMLRSDFARRKLR